MKFRKKPVVIDAVQFDGSGMSCEAVSVFIDGGTFDGRIVTWKPRTNDGGFINTLEGRMEFGVGDWIIRGVKGEFYPRKPDIFDATYEPVEE